MDIAMPPAFPADEFRAFGLAASSFFPPILSEQSLYDPLERTTHFNWSYQAVLYRYRICAETADEFKTLLCDASDEWREGWFGWDENLNYKLERCIYVFFMSALSVFESFGFCLYFLGSALKRSDFPFCDSPKKITLTATSAAFAKTFPHTEIASRLADLLQTPDFTSVDAFRNILAHRVSGRRSIQVSTTVHSGGAVTPTRKETWHIPGSLVALEFNEQMLHTYLAQLTVQLLSLVTAARDFTQNC
jgi:hypothetical protein